MLLYWSFRRSVTQEEYALQTEIDFYTNLVNRLRHEKTVQLVQIRELGPGLVIGFEDDGFGIVDMPVAYYDSRWQIKPEAVANDADMDKQSKYFPTCGLSLMVADTPSDYLGRNMVTTIDGMEEVIRLVLVPTMEAGYHQTPIEREDITVS